jgi:hypothetical protein
MPSLSLSVPHALAAEEATTRLKGLTKRLRARYADKMDDVDEWWGKNRGDFTLTISGVKVKGDADVGDDAVRLRVDLPFIAMAFKSSIESAIRTEVQACLK